MTLASDIAARTRLITDTEGETRAILEEALVRIQAILAAAPSDAEQWRLEALAEDIRRVLRESGNEAALAVGAAQDATAAAGRVLVDGAVARAGARLVLPIVSNTQVAAMKEFLTAKIKDVTLEAANRINTELGLALIGAQSPLEAQAKVAAILKEATSERARTIVRTELGRAYSASAFARLAQAAEFIPGMQKKWVKSGKAHPRLEHQLIGGQVRAWDKPFDLRVKTATGWAPIQMMYPHDPKAPPAATINCGCVMVPVVPKGA